MLAHPLDRIVTSTLISSHYDIVSPIWAKNLTLLHCLAVAANLCEW